MLLCDILILFASYSQLNVAVEHQKQFAITYEQAHRLFGHIGKPMTKMICNYRGWNKTHYDIRQYLA